jgi:hypothetical protein
MRFDGSCCDGAGTTWGAGGIILLFEDEGCVDCAPGDLETRVSSPAALTTYSNESSIMVDSSELGERDTRCWIAGCEDSMGDSALTAGELGAIGIDGDGAAIVSGGKWDESRPSHCL